MRRTVPSNVRATEAKHDAVMIAGAATWVKGLISEELTILYSGGIESAVLVAEALGAGVNLEPVYVTTGTRWEREELAAASSFLEAIDQGQAPMAAQ